MTTTLPPLAFVDLETTGLSPTRDRVTEIGVVTVDGGTVEEWTSFLHPGRELAERSRLFDGIDNEVASAMPRFCDIAQDLNRRLAGHLFIAHNARFDFGFLRSEFLRAGIDFAPQVLCSVMLSRKLDPALPAHDLDTLVRCHGLPEETRHRALPDARTVWHWWRAMRERVSADALDAAVEALLAGPVLPLRLDPTLVTRLPDTSGVFVLRDESGAVLHSAQAQNLRLAVVDYFRVDRISAKALAMSHLVRDIEWRETQGRIGAHLLLNAMASGHGRGRRNKTNNAANYSFRLLPDAMPCVQLVPFASDAGSVGNYGMYASERKATNALTRLAAKRGLCKALLGIEDEGDDCAACEYHGPLFAKCGEHTQRLHHLLRATQALKELRVASWPYDGPVGIRERADLHVIHNWRYLGTARNEAEVHEALVAGAEFSESTFAYLAKTLPKVPLRRIVPLRPLGIEREPSVIQEYAGQEQTAPDYALQDCAAPEYFVDPA